MAGRERLLAGLPRLDPKSAGLRMQVRAQPELVPGRDVFIYRPSDQTPRLEIPNVEYLSRLARREAILARPKERIPAIDSEYDHTKPAVIANSAVYVNTYFGSGWLPFEYKSPMLFQSHLDNNTKLYPKEFEAVKEIYVIQHGVMRNAKDYYSFFIDALNKAGREYDPKTMLVIAPQFLAPVDLRGKTKLVGGIDADDFLRWRYNDWKGAEPALNPFAPVDSFTAMDALLNVIVNQTPNVQKIEFIGNSEGAQFLDRYLPFSKFLNDITYNTSENRPTPFIVGSLSNPGTQLFWDSWRPIFNYGSIVDWKEYDQQSSVNQWPLGLYDPSPYILESLNQWPHGDSIEYPNDPLETTPYDLALTHCLSRIDFAAGTADDVEFSYHLPIGPGPGYNAQGRTRYKRFTAKLENLNRIREKKRSEEGITLPGINEIHAVNFGHDAKKIIAALVSRFQMDNIY